MAVHARVAMTRRLEDSRTRGFEYPGFMSLGKVDEDEDEEEEEKRA